MKVKSYYTDANVNGSCRQGSVFTTYQILKDILGEPQYTDADPLEKVSCEWTLKAEVVNDYGDTEFQVASIYAWKYGYIPTDECQWNIGGNSYIAQDIIEQIIERRLTSDE